MDSLGKMTLKKVWIPTSQAQAPDDEAERLKLAPVDTKRGASYVVETGSEPFFPRGAVTPVTEQDDDEENDFDDATAVHPNRLEQRFRHLVLCGVSASDAVCRRPY
jgi:Na+-exporting ATPase